MTILLNSTLIHQPAQVKSEWITVNDVLFRQVSLLFDAVSPEVCQEILSLCSAGQPVNLTYLDPVANAPAALAVRLYSAAVSCLEEVNGQPAYAPASFVLRSVPG